MIRTFLEKRKARKVLGKYVGTDAAESVLRGDDIERQPLKPARIEFVLVFVAGDTPEEISARVGRVAEIATSHDGVVHDMIGQLVVVAFGTLRGASSQPGSRPALVVESCENCHGAADGHCEQFSHDSTT